MGRQLLLGVVVQAAVYLQALVLFPIVIWHAGAQGYGEFVVFVALLYLLYGLYASGIPYRYRRELVSARNADERRALFGPQFAFQLLSLAAVSLAIVVWATVSQTVGVPGSVLIFWLVCHTFYRFIADYFRYTLRLGLFNFLSAAPPYLFLLFILADVFFKASLSVERLILLQACGFALPALFFAGRLLCEIGLPRPMLRWRTLVDDFKLGAPLTAELIIDFLLASSDRFLIAAFLSLADVGRYQPAYTLGMLVIFLPKVFDAIMLPNLNRLIDRGKTAEAERLVRAMFNLVLLIAVPFAAAALFVGPTLLRLLTTPEIASASRWVTPIVACAAACYGLMLIAGQVAFALRRTRVILVANAAGGAVNVILNLIVLPLVASIVVPAVTTLLGYGVGLALTTLSLRGSWRFKIDWPVPLRCATATMAMTFLLYQLGYRPGVPIAATPLTLAEAVVAASATYFAVLWLAGARIRQFRDVLAYVGDS
jgi:O-antigen/teichoic acid export membrane protein